ncbi:hypothetical protein BSU04_45320 [Caballeronia sordidicola]|uniref:Uncharacterized protein n=1 Tax=Caballeronia sordidicola TaxID=196367 RepID=A0A226WKP7_CABSO|nr:hypothetical protein BSU04_45320 [Caballeronia sordidicola]
MILVLPHEYVRFASMLPVLNRRWSLRRGRRTWTRLTKLKLKRFIKKMI